VTIEAGAHKLGPDNASLQVDTKRAGAAAKAGHDLVIDVTSWEATVDVGDDPSQIKLELKADPGSFKVREGSGGVTELGDDDKADIEKTIAEEVHEGQAIEFHSTDVKPSADGGNLSVSGDLTLAGESRPVSFELSLSPEGQLKGSTTLKQTDWGIKPYSALFGTLKVADEVKVTFEAQPLS
jgi:polyisoprenoid-binding protein YceI